MGFTVVFYVEIRRSVAAGAAGRGFEEFFAETGMPARRVLV